MKKKKSFIQYNKFAQALARRAGKIILRNFDVGMKKEWKRDLSPVTATDRAVNRLVLQTLKKTFPHHGILSEESKEIKGSSDYTWVCDPIDGTIPFSHGIPTSVFSIALTKNGESVVGVVFDPFLNRMYSAIKGRGATMNGKRIKVSQKRSFKKAIVGIETWNLWAAEHNRDITVVMAAMNKTKTTTLRLASAVYQGMLVAMGESVAAAGAHIYPWDTAAVKIIVEEAGGKVTDIDGKEQRYDRPIKGFIASNGYLHNNLVAIFRRSKIR